ncbi:polysaccharide biosynthesis C-terminal domain-containing protein [Amedibacillus sp. YH-ame6]
MKILVTGSKGFVGKNLVSTLNAIQTGKSNTYDILIDEVYEYDIDNTKEDLKKFCQDCDFVINLAGVNRPQDPSEFYDGNKGFAETLCSYLNDANNIAPILLSSSIQVGRDNDYAKSKKEGEALLQTFGNDNGNKIYIYRFANLFGKWCKPNYNSVTATWCYNIANGKDIQINDPNVELPLCYIDDVVEEIIHCMMGDAFEVSDDCYGVKNTYNISLGDLASLLKSFKDSRVTLNVINQNDELTKKLYATYLSYLPENEFSYTLKMNKDERGSFTEFLKTKEYGQVSVNISKPGITKGNHWHHTKNEKFLVVSGTGLIQFRKIDEGKIFEYRVSGEKLEVIDIPVGYTHNIINLGEQDMVTIMWANETFDPNKPDTYYEEVKKNA